MGEFLRVHFRGVDLSRSLIFIKRYECAAEQGLL
jgi:hypothetical protein